ncbi:cobalt ECF transporter T component CbiQ [Desulfovirgula thermocuniculi]|uniref:cobalt ECF transporter T component CbiQ n=1 Tax=Desulfovirgula thermocuniculi TaxID=348842 RepID=UPI0003FBF377|nr:cobalt ECF transporter T component CbiQ [Desulfovirgula thermocuniculi]
MEDLWLREQVEGHPGASPLHRMEPRVKTAALAGFVILATLLSSRTSLILAAIFLLLLSRAARLSLSHLVFRLLGALPFVGLVCLLLPFVTPGEAIWRWTGGFVSLAVSREGLDRASLLGLRVLVALLALNLLVATTGAVRLFKALSSLGVPGIFLQLIELTIRYIFVMAEELGRMRQARAARGFVPGRHLFCRRTFSDLGQMVGALFVRSWLRGERIYLAMLARGYAGAPGKALLPPPGSRDLAWGAVIVSIPLCLHLLEAGREAWILLWK